MQNEGGNDEKMKWDIIICVVVFNVAAMLLAGWYTNRSNK